MIRCAAIIIQTTFYAICVLDHWGADQETIDIAQQKDMQIRI